MEKVYANENLRENLEILKEMGYKYIVKALSGFEEGAQSWHVHLIAAKDLPEMYNILDNLRKDDKFSYFNCITIDWLPFNNYAAIERYTTNRSFTITNDLTRYLTK